MKFDEHCHELEERRREARATLRNKANATPCPTGLDTWMDEDLERRWPDDFAQWMAWDQRCSEALAQRTVITETLARLKELQDQQMPKDSQSPELMFRINRELYRLEHHLPALGKRTELEDVLRTSQAVVVRGSTGSGKSTQLPAYIADMEGYEGRRVICTQPREVAARALADRVQEEWMKDEARIVYMTETALLRDLCTEGTSTHEILNKCAAIVVDEAHERNATTDLLLGVIKRLLPQFKKLRLIVASATIDVQQFSNYLGKCPILEIPGRLFPVAVEFRPTLGSLFAIEDCHAVTERAVEEVRRVSAILARRGTTRVLPLALHGGLSKAVQASVLCLGSDDVRKVIYSTNIAETSLTIEGVSHVVDCGLAKGLVYDLHRNTRSLRLLPITQSSADQRCGPCGTQEETRSFQGMSGMIRLTWANGPSECRASATYESALDANFVLAAFSNTNKPGKKDKRPLLKGNGALFDTDQPRDERANQFKVFLDSIPREDDEEAVASELEAGGLPRPSSVFVHRKPATQEAMQQAPTLAQEMKYFRSILPRELVRNLAQASWFDEAQLRGGLTYFVEPANVQAIAEDPRTVAAVVQQPPRNGQPYRLEKCYALSVSARGVRDAISVGIAAARQSELVAVLRRARARGVRVLSQSTSGQHCHIELSAPSREILEQLARQIEQATNRSELIEVSPAEAKLLFSEYGLSLLREVERGEGNAICVEASPGTSSVRVFGDTAENIARGVDQAVEAAVRKLSNTAGIVDLRLIQTRVHAFGAAAALDAAETVLRPHFAKRKEGGGDQCGICFDDLSSLRLCGCRICDACIAQFLTIPGSPPQYSLGADQHITYIQDNLLVSKCPKGHDITRTRDAINNRT
eukprot:m51a1_g13951 putative atp-dependent rna (870) ;mRNA; r:914209-919333